MSHDLAALQMWVLVSMAVASLGATAVPFLYSFFPWRLRPIGKLFMLQSISFALVLDLSVVLNIWTPSSLMLLFWINILIFTFIAVATTLMALWFATRIFARLKKGTKDVSAE